MKNNNPNPKKSKKTISPHLEIKGPKIKKYKVDIINDRIIIGRLADFNDIALQPDPQKLVTRNMHCSIELRKGIFWLIDNASKNGTFLKRGDVMKRVHGEEKLENRDLILILAEVNSDETTKYWEINFVDPHATEDAMVSKPEQHIEYDWIQAKLFLMNGLSRKEIKGLSPQEHSLIRYLDQRNKNNGNIPVMCTYDELIIAIWDEYSEIHSKNDVNRLVWGLRKKIETNSQNPKFLHNIRGMGYRFVTNP